MGPRGGPSAHTLRIVACKGLGFATKVGLLHSMKCTFWFTEANSKGITEETIFAMVYCWGLTRIGISVGRNSWDGRWWRSGDASRSIGWHGSWHRAWHSARHRSGVTSWNWARAWESSSGELGWVAGFTTDCSDAVARWRCN